MTEFDPATFDLDAWISGASRPERTVTVYRDGHLLAELDEIDAQIKAAKAVAPENLGITEVPPSESLERQWEDVAARFVTSALPVRVRALTQAEYRAAHKAGVKACGGEAKADPDVIGLHVVAAASVAPKMSPAQAAALRDAIGEPQMGLIAQAVTDLRTKGLPKVSATFPRPRP